MHLLLQRKMCLEWFMILCVISNDVYLNNTDQHYTAFIYRQYFNYQITENSMHTLYGQKSSAGITNPINYNGVSHTFVLRHLTIQLLHFKQRVM